jgi:hypothetical protein
MRLRNQMEGHFNRMQGSLSLMTEDADRVRLQDWDKVEALLHLAELRMNALSLAAERGHNYVGHALPPDGDVALLPEHPFGRDGRLAKRRAQTTARARTHGRNRRPAPAPSRHAVAAALAPPAPAVTPAPPAVAPTPAVAPAPPAVADDASAADRSRAAAALAPAASSPRKRQAHLDEEPATAPVPAPAAGTENCASPARPSAALSTDGAQVIAVDFRARRRRTT